MFPGLLNNPSLSEKIPSETGQEPVRFASVRYRTKSGRIWEGNRARPVESHDLKKEIDITSYGCWTEILEGKEIPLDHIRFGIERDHWGYPLAKTLLKVSKKTLGKIPYRCLDLLKDINLLLVTTFSYSIPEMTDFLEKYRDTLKDGNREVVVLGAMEETLDIFRRRWEHDPKALSRFIDFANACDIFLTPYHSGTKRYHELLMKTPVVYFPLFFPVQFAQQFAVNTEDKKREILVVTSKGNTDRITSLLVAKEIQKRHPDFLIRVVLTEGTNLSLLSGCRYECVPRLPWKEYLQVIRECYLFVNLDVSWTGGRPVTDAAAVGSPCIGCNAANQEYLFPDLTVSELVGLEKAIELAVRLIEEPSFYRQVVLFAEKRLQSLSLEKGKGRVASLLAAFRKGALSQWDPFSPSYES